MRKLILDTETTGLDYNKDRIIECACLELIDNQHTEKRFHNYYNPSGVIISQQSEEIHGLSNAFLTKYKSFDETKLRNTQQRISLSERTSRKNTEHV